VISILCERASQDKDKDVRYATIQVLGKFPNPSAEVISLFCERASQDEEPWIRRAAIEALSKLPNPSAEVISFFCERASQDKDDRVRMAAIKALSKLPNPSVEMISLFCERASQDKDDRVRMAAIKALSKLPNPSVEMISLFCERVSQEKNRDVRDAAIEALGNLAHPTPEVISILCERASQDKSKYVRWAFIQALGKLPHPTFEVISFLCKRASQGKSPSVREDAIYALGELAHPTFEVISFLCERASQDENKYVKKTATRVLVRTDVSLLIRAYLSTPEQSMQKQLTSIIAQRVLAEGHALVITRHNIQIYDGKTQPFGLPAKNGEILAKQLKEACHEKAQEQGLPPVMRLSVLVAEALQERLRQVSKAQETFLSLKACGLTDAQVKKYLTPFLQQHRILISLDLSQNALTDASACLIADALQAHESLTELNLLQNPISKQGVQAFIRLLDGQVQDSSWFGSITTKTPTRPLINKTLCVVHLSVNLSLPVATLENLQLLLKRNQTWAQAGQRLLNAIEVHQLDNIEKALNAGALLTTMDKEGQCPLHFAVLLGHLEAVQYLIENSRCPVDIQNRFGMTAFYVACANGQWRIANYLLSQGTNVNAADASGCTVLHHAVACENEVILNYLLTDPTIRKTILVDKQDQNGQTPLHYAIRDRSETCTRLLVAHGAALELKDKHGDTPMAMAYRSGYPTLISYLENASLSLPVNLSSPVKQQACPQHEKERWIKILITPDHMCLETPTLLLTLWPDFALESEQKPSEGEIVLYSLDMEKFAEEYQLFQNSSLHWALKGRHKFLATDQSCSGLAYDLLSASGLHYLIGIHDQPAAMTLNTLGALATRAKQAELEKYPASRQYTPTPAMDLQQHVEVTQKDYQHALKVALSALMPQKIQVEQNELEQEPQTSEVQSEFKLLQLYQGLAAQPIAHPTAAESTQRNSVIVTDDGKLCISLSIPYGELTWGERLGGGAFGDVYLGTYQRDLSPLKGLKIGVRCR